MKPVQSIRHCRSCAGGELLPVLDLGKTPLADRLLRPIDLARPEPRVPLRLAFCPHCSLVQILETVAPELLFDQHYPYFSSVSAALVRHARRNAQELIRRLGLNRQSLVVEAASNDGYLLQFFQRRGIPVLGIDPSAGPVRAARARNIPTLETFFTEELARRMAAQGLRADLLLANNVLAHVPDLNGFVAGIARLLKEQGTAVLEVPYLLDLLRKCEFDTIYHQHLCYFSVTALDALFRRHGLYLNRLRPLRIHGGSLRLYLERRERVSPEVTAYLKKEQEVGITKYRYYQSFSKKVGALRERLNSLLEQLRRQGKRIAAYGAAAKATTLLSYCGLDAARLEYVVDLNPFKQGKFLPGSRLPIFPTQRLLEDRPDYCLLLAWNFQREILKQQQVYRRAGGRFIVPIPEVRVL